MTRNPFQRLARCVLPLVVAGCASMAPTYERPALPVADQYPAEAPRGTVSAAPAAAAIGWRDYFADPGLHALIEQALLNNRDLRASILRVTEARALYGIQRADRYPTIAVGAEETRARTPGDVNLAGVTLTRSTYQAFLALSTWELDFWGRIRSLEAAALESYLATDAARWAFIVSLVAQVADTWLVQRELDQRIDLARLSIATREESFRIFSRRYELGASSRLELTQVETLLTQAQALLLQLEQSRAANSHALALLVGGPVDATPQLGALDGQGGMRPLDPGLPSGLLTSRPDLIAAEYRLKSANANIGAARAAFFPQITLTGAFGTASAELDGLFGAGSRVWSYTPSITLPIFTAGRLRASLELAEVRRDLAVAAYERTVQVAFRDVSDALTARHWLAQQLAVRRTALATQRERARLAQLRYDSGAVTYLEVLDAQRDLLTAGQDAVQAQRALLSSHVALYAALGGGLR